jgi:hypothetical protein
VSVVLLLLSLLVLFGLRVLVRRGEDR